MASVEKWVGFGSAMAGVALLWPKMPEHVHDEVRSFITTCMRMVASSFNPYEQVTISEYSEEHFRRSELFDAITAYLSDRCADGARKLKVDLVKDSELPQVTLDENQEITDNFEGARIWWNLSSRAPKNRGNVISVFPAESEPRRYRAAFHKRHRQLVLKTYLEHIVRRGRELTAKKRQKRLFTNNRKQSVWSHVPFEHPATFATLAMDPAEKEAVIDDLMAFQEGKDYYSKVGKAWKRGYLLFGPPGTGKSTMIAAMANFLDYDVYDLELTAVKNNTELRKLFIETTGKSIIVIEDIDCSVDLTGKRKDKKASGDKSEDDDKPKLPMGPEDDGTKVTLSGVLNFIDGLWSACGGERIIVFTTNHKEKLDPALIRRGRMDKHIEMSYCRFEAFKVLASNYLDVDEHELFGEIRRLLEEADMSPADVAENLMPMSKKKKRDPDACFVGLIEALKKAKEDAAAKALAEAKAKEEEEAKAAKEKEEAEAKKANEKEEAAEAKEGKGGQDDGKEKASDEVKKADGET